MSGVVTTIGGCEVGREIGRGGNGVVYEAIQLDLRRAVAVKLMHTVAVGADQLHRFEREALHLARLRHPAIAQVFAAGTHRQGVLAVPYFVMERIPDPLPITAYARSMNLSIRQRIELFAEVCDAVQHAHEQGVLHLDLKPANVLVDGQGRTKLIDFGIAQSLARPGSELTTVHTTRSHLLGTLQYMSPEQAAAVGSVDTRSDVYSLGLVLYELLVGRRPYDLTGMTLVEATGVIRERDVPRPGKADGTLRGSVEAVLLKALEKDPARRFESAAAFAQDLRRILADEAPHARPRSALRRVRDGVRRIARKHWALTALVSTVLAATAATKLGRWLEFQGARRVFERELVTRVPFIPSAPLQFVTILALEDGTEIEALAASEGIDGVDSTNLHSLRRLHGRLMEKLAAAGPRVVVWDVQFGPTAPAFDGDFVRGVRALREAGAPVVVGATGWRLGVDGRPEVSPAIESATTCGFMTGGVAAHAPWTLHVLVKRGAASPMPSLALSALAAYWQPDAGWSAEFALQDAEIRYTRALAASPRTIPLSAVDLRRFDDAPSGLRSGDVVGKFIIAVPSDVHLAQSTVGYAEAFHASAASLRERVAGKIVLVGDFRHGRDGPFAYPDGRKLVGAVAHAVALEQILSERVISRPRPFVIPGMTVYTDAGFLADFVAAPLAVALFALCARSRRAGRNLTIGSIGAAMLVFSASIGIYYALGVLYCPLVSLLVFSGVIGVLWPLWRLRCAAV